MKFRYAFVLLFLAAFVSWAQEEPVGLDQAVGGGAPPPTAAAPSQPEVVAPVRPAERLTISQRIAQLMIVTTQGVPAPDTSDRAFLLRYPPGGVMLPTLMRPSSAAEYVVALRSMPLETATGVGLFIGANLYELPHYGYGPRNFFPSLPSLLSLAAAQDPSATAALADLMAVCATQIGLNMHLGPSLELASSLPDVEGTIQTLGSDPTFTADTGCALLKALADKGILAVPVGFPGGGLNRHGDGPAVLITPRKYLRDMDIAPFARAIENGAEMVHVSNTLVPTLEPDNLPASLSRVVMTDLLRGELKFEGVILAGPMDSPDIARGRDASDSALASLQAGADMLLWNSAGQRVMKTVDELTAAVARGDLSEALINEKLARVIALKEKRRLREKPLPRPADAEKLEKKRQYPKEAYRIERRSITLVKNDGLALPLTKENATPVGITGTVGVDALFKALQKPFKKLAMQPIMTAREGGEIFDFEIDRVKRGMQGAHTVICILTNNTRTSSQVDLLKMLKAQNAHVVLVLVGYPSALPKLAMADAIVLAYSNPDAIDESIQAIAEVLMGNSPVAVRKAEHETRVAVGRPVRFNVLDVVRAPVGRLPLTFEAPFVAGMSVLYDPTASIDKVRWEFGDGKKSNDLLVEHAYEAPGAYSATLTVTDQQGDVSTGAFPITVESAAPPTGG